MSAPQRFALFEAFPRDEATGKRLVPTNYITPPPEKFRLGAWVTSQRQLHKNGDLSEDRLERLLAAGILWDLQLTAWEEGLQHLEQMPRNSAGKRVFSVKLICADGFKLGQWLTTQRSTYARGGLVEERALKLEAAGVIWDPQEAAWEEGFNHLVAYSEKTERSTVPTSFIDEDGYRLGAWQHTQRTLYKKVRRPPSSALRAAPGAQSRAAQSREGQSRGAWARARSRGRGTCVRRAWQAGADARGS